MRNGRLCDTLTLEPNPSFVPHSTAENVLTGTRAKIWVDDATAQIVGLSNRDLRQRGAKLIICDVCFRAAFANHEVLKALTVFVAEVPI